MLGPILETLIGGLFTGVLYALVALGFVLIFKASGVFNFAQGAMVLFAALSVARLAEVMPLVAAVALTVSRLGASDVPAIVAVLGDAFFDYPVMRFVLGPAEPYGTRLARLVELFVRSRALRHDPLLGIRDGGALVGAATLTVPESPAAPPDFVALRDGVWAELGADARARYDAYVDATEPFAPAALALITSATVPAATATVLTFPLFTGTGDIDRQCSTLQLFAVEHFHGFVCFFGCR